MTRCSSMTRCASMNCPFWRNLVRSRLDSVGSQDLPRDEVMNGDGFDAHRHGRSGDSWGRSPQEASEFARYHASVRDGPSNLLSLWSIGWDVGAILAAPSHRFSRWMNYGKGRPIHISCWLVGAGWPGRFVLNNLPRELLNVQEIHCFDVLAPWSSPASVPSR